MRPDVDIQQRDQPAEDEMAYVSRQFRAFNDQRGGVHPSKPLHLFAYGPDKEVLGGLFGEISWGWLHVDVIWVHEDWRHAGIGGSLMDRAEAESSAMGVQRAYLETTDFQAVDFYVRRGYEVFARLEEQPPGHVCYYMQKIGLV